MILWYHVYMKKISVSGVPTRPSLFWDVDPRTVDPQKHARYIIERILDFGTKEELRWLFRQYPRSEIARVLRLPRSQVKPKSRSLWDLVLK